MQAKKIIEMTDSTTVTIYETTIAMPKCILDELRMHSLEWLDEAHVNLQTGEVTLSVSVTHSAMT